MEGQDGNDGIRYLSNKRIYFYDQPIGAIKYQIGGDEKGWTESLDDINESEMSVLI